MRLGAALSAMLDRQLTEAGGSVTHYVIRVAGQLSDDLLTAFPLLVATTEPVTTVLQGLLPDQSALTAVIDHLDELGIHIIGLTSLPEVTTTKRPPRN
jgi:hypothetical protein